MNFPLENTVRPLISKHAFLEAYLGKDSVTFNLLITSTKKGQMVVDEKLISSEKIEEILNCLTAKTPVQLILTGNGIVTRLIQTSDENDREPSTLIAENFPNLNLSEIYYSIYQKGNSGLISIIRKSKFDELLNRSFALLNIKDVTVGGSDISKIAEYSGQTDLEISFRNSTYHFIHSQLIKIQDSELNCKSIQIADETVEPELFIPFGRALRHYDNSNDKLVDKDLEIKNSKWMEDFNFQALYGLLWKSALGFFLVALLGNYFVFDYISTINNTYAADITSLETNNDRLKENKQKSVKLTSLLAKYGFSNKKLTAIEMNDLTNALPDGMSFTEVVFHPKVKSRNKRIIKFDSKKIILKGSALHVSMLNEYIKEIHLLPWIKYIEIVTLADNDKTNRLHFSVEIKLES